MSIRSAKPVRKRGKPRRHPLQKIKMAACYDVAEISALFGLHRNTVRHWFKDGLPAIDKSRPVLVHGLALKEFLAKRQSAKTQVCGPGEFFCFRCKIPRQPWGGLVDFKAQTEKVSRATALCESCETVMHRVIRRDDIPLFCKSGQSA